MMPTVPASLLGAAQAQGGQLGQRLAPEDLLMAAATMQENTKMQPQPQPKAKAGPKQKFHPHMPGRLG